MKKCRVCPIKFSPKNTLQVVCSPMCAIEYAKRQAEKKKRAEEIARVRAARAERAARKDALKTRSDWIKEAQRAFNAFIRERDRVAGHNCISSGKPLDWTGNAVDAGHYRSIGSAPHLRFDERNCHAQSKQDNRYLSGNAVDYRIGLIARIGLHAVESLEADQTVRRYTIDDLKEIKRLYKQKLKDLQKQRKAA